MYFYTSWRPAQIRESDIEVGLAVECFQQDPITDKLWFVRCRRQNLVRAGRYHIRAGGIMTISTNTFGKISHARCVILWCKCPHVFRSGYKVCGIVKFSQRQSFLLLYTVEALKLMTAGCKVCEDLVSLNSA